MPSPIRGIPYIDPNVDHVGMNRLREMNASKLKKLKRTLVVRDDETPLAVVLPFKTFLRIQREIDRLSELVEEGQDQVDPLFFGSFPEFDDPGLPDLDGENDASDSASATSIDAFRPKLDSE